MSKYDAMSKADLRNACKAAEIKYGNMTNETMRAALKQKELNDAAVNAQLEEHLQTWDKPAAVVIEAPAADPAPVEAAAPAAAEPTPAKEPKAPRKPADQRNSISRPGEGTACRLIWDTIDAIKTEGVELSFDNIKARLPDVNDATIRTQRQRHKKFHA